MRKILTLVVALAIVAVAYLATFGLPASVASLFGGADNQAVAATKDGQAARGAGGPAAGGGRGGGTRATSVVTTALELQPYENVMTAIGTASAVRSIDVVSKASGTVTETNLAANRSVQAGEVLVRFDARTEALNVEIAQANLDQANDTVARYDRMRAGGSSTVTDVTLSEARVAQRLAEAALGLAQVALDDRTLRAPFAGQLSLSDVEIGDVLAANTVIASIDQSDTLTLEFELPERAIGILAVGKTVLASTSTFTGRVFNAKITSFDSRIDSVTRSVSVKAQLENPDNALWPGMTFSVRVIQETEPLPSVPSTAITWSRTGSSVWIDKDGEAISVPATILFRRNETAWIDADIPTGTLVVTEGAQKLRAGAKITDQNAETNRAGRAGKATPDASE